MKRALGAGFLGLGGLRSFACLIEALLPFGGLGVETSAFFQGLVDRVTFFVFDAEEKTFPVQFIYDVVEGVFNLIDTVLERCIAFGVSRYGLPELWPVHKVQRFPGFLK